MRSAPQHIIEPYHRYVIREYVMTDQYYQIFSSTSSLHTRVAKYIIFFFLSKFYVYMQTLRFMTGICQIPSNGMNKKSCNFYTEIVFPPLSTSSSEWNSQQLLIITHLALRIFCCHQLSITGLRAFLWYSRNFFHHRLQCARPLDI